MSGSPDGTVAVVGARKMVFSTFAWASVAQRAKRAQIKWYILVGYFCNLGISLLGRHFRIGKLVVLFDVEWRYIPTGM